MKTKTLTQKENILSSSKATDFIHFFPTLILKLTHQALQNYWLKGHIQLPYSIQIACFVKMSSHFSSVSFGFSSVQSLSRVWLFATPWITARQASLSITNSRSPPKLMSIKSMMPSSHLILCRPLLLLPPIPPSIRVFSNVSTLAWGGQSTGISALASFLPKNTQDWSPLEWTGWISLQSKGLSRVFSNTTVHKHQFFSAQLSSQFNSHIHTWPLEKP